MKRALSCVVTAVGVVLVSSCGSSTANPSETPTAPPVPQYRVLDRFEFERYPITIVCRGNDMYVITDTHYGKDVERFDNHKECE